MANEILHQHELNECYGSPHPWAVKKQIDRLDEHCRHFISLSPFLVLASSSDKGTDASPRGDAPGFVTVIDDHTLIIPDRRGNNRVDSMTNIMENPNVGLLFFVPGIPETLRVNGRARVTTDPSLLEPMAVGGKVPKSGLLVEAKEVYLHCGKALIRSKLWDPETQVQRSSFPTLGRMLKDQIAEIDSVEEADQTIEESYRTRLY